MTAPQAGGVDQRVVRPPQPRSPAHRRARGSRGLRWSLAAVVLSVALFAFLLNGVGGRGRPAESETEPTSGGGAAARSEAVVSASLCLPTEDLIPARTSSPCGAEVVSALFSPLVAYDQRTSTAVWGDEAPRAMATSVTSEDQKTWTITLKDSWTFHDGTPVTAQAFVDAWNHNAYRPNAAVWSFVFSTIDGYSDLQCETDDADTCTDEMSGLTAVDEQTIRVTLSQPFSQFPLVLTALAFSPLPESFYDDQVAYGQAPIGTGPFRIDGEWDRAGDIRLVRYEDYAGDPAAISGVEFHVTPDTDVSYESFNAGEHDLAKVPPWRTNVAQDEHPDTYVEGWNSRFEYLGIPMHDDRFTRRALRRAISMAIDREAITRTVLPDAVPADAFVPPGIAGYREGSCGSFCEYDPQRAKQALETAGGFEGTLTLWFNSGGDHEQWMELVAEQLRDNLDLDVELESAEFTDYLQQLSGGEITGPYRLGWITDYPSAQNYLEPLLYTDTTSNYTGWSEPQFDSHIDEGNTARSVAAGLDSYAQAEDIAIGDMPLIPLFFHQNAVVHGEQVNNVELNHAGLVNWADVTVDDPAG